VHGRPGNTLAMPGGDEAWKTSASHVPGSPPVVVHVLLEGTHGPHVPALGADGHPGSEGPELPDPPRERPVARPAHREGVGHRADRQHGDPAGRRGPDPGGAVVARRPRTGGGPRGLPRAVPDAPRPLELRGRRRRRGGGSRGPGGPSCG